jgi:hypothetical protein
MIWVGHVAPMGRVEGKRSIGIPRTRWADNIKMYLQEVGCEDFDWIDVVQDRDRCCEDFDWIDVVQDRDRCRARVSAVVSLRVP